MAWDIFPERTTQLLEKSLTWLSRRQEIIAGNIANLDTPDFTRKELNFNRLLANYLQGGQAIHPMTRHVAHLPGLAPGIRGGIEDPGDAVNLDQEMAFMAENQLRYQASVQMLNKKIDQLRTVVEGGK